jgi:DedD protein
LSKRKGIIYLLALIALGAVAYTVYFGGTEPFEEPEIIKKTIKIVVPEEKPPSPAPVKEAAGPGPEPVPSHDKVAKAGPELGPEPEPKTPLPRPEAPTPKPPDKKTPLPQSKVPTAKPLAKKAPVAATFKPWAINVSSFKNRTAAQKFAQEIRSAGYNAYVTDFTLKNVKWHRVRVGFYETEAKATRVREELAKRFNRPDAWMVKPGRREVLKHMK